MGTQGLVTLIDHDGRVLLKAICGHGGGTAFELASAIRELDDEQLTLENVWAIAEKVGFGCTDLHGGCRVVMTVTDIMCADPDDLSPRYRATFRLPQFNPRWERGTADYVVLFER
jgi:hypothetical protein